MFVKRKEWWNEQHPCGDKVLVLHGWKPVSTEGWRNIIMQLIKTNLSEAKILSFKSTIFSLPIGGEAEFLLPGNRLSELY